MSFINPDGTVEVRPAASALERAGGALWSRVRPWVWAPAGVLGVVLVFWAAMKIRGFWILSKCRTDLAMARRDSEIACLGASGLTGGATQRRSRDRRDHETDG